MHDLDDLTEALKKAKRSLQNATDDYESAERHYYEDPCKVTEERLRRARWRLTESSDAYDELCDEPIFW